MPKLSLWSRATEVAARTPTSRNRYVDFLRALSILAVISGHWLMAAPYVNGGQLTLPPKLPMRVLEVIQMEWLSRSRRRCVAGSTGPRRGRQRCW